MALDAQRSAESASAQLAQAQQRQAAAEQRAAELEQRLVDSLAAHEDSNRCVPAAECYAFLNRLGLGNI